MKEIVSYKELESISKQLDGMLTKHVDWLSSLHKVIVCKLPSNSLKMDYNDCEFGQWYRSVTNITISESPEFIRLGNTHQNLHNLASQLLIQYNAKETPTQQDYELFVDAEKEFFENLHSFIDNVLATKNQFDDLTNIPNRCLVSLMLEKEYSKFLRNNGSYCIAFADIDFFKDVNDSYGHDAGDIVLKNVAKLFASEIRPFDTVGRFGGEEFIFCFPQTNIDDVFFILERLRNKLETSSVHIDNTNEVSVNCSFGIAMMQAHMPLKETIKQADEALYTAKHRGRNRIEVWSEARTRAK